MVKIIAFSADSEPFRYERLLDKSWMAKFPGAAWLPILVENLRLKQLRVTSSDVALNHVNSGFWKANEIGVIQHLDNSDSDKLIKLGATPLILMAMESPLYAKKFFDNISLIAQKFPVRIMLQGLYDHLPNDNNNYTLRFPAYLNADIINITPWHKRKFMTMVVQNMYNEPLSPILFKYPFDILKWVYRYIRLFSFKKSVLKNKFEFSSLHDKRLEAVIFFGRKNRLDFFGRRWDNIKNLPRYYQRKLIPVFKNLNPNPIEDKINTISNYKFALCFENAAYKGGVSEKIIDCFVAGVIPVYLGATNIQEFVPKEAFIDVRLFNSWEELYQKLEGITEEEASSIIDKGREFLYSNEGQMHSYEGFATFMKELILQECNKINVIDNKKITLN